MLTHGEIEMLCLDLIAYCQRNNLLSSNSNVCEELASITDGIDADEIEEWMEE